jgi:hypothetical protein
MSLPTTPLKSLSPLSITPATGTGSEPTSASSTRTRKRKQAAFDTYQLVSSNARDLLKGDKDDPLAYKKAIQNVLAAFDDLIDMKRFKTEDSNMQASSIKDIAYAVSLFGLDYFESKAECVWEAADGPEISLSPEAGIFTLPSQS